MTGRRRTVRSRRWPYRCSSRSPARPPSARSRASWAQPPRSPRGRPAAGRTRAPGARPVSGVASFALLEGADVRVRRCTPRWSREGADAPARLRAGLFARSGTVLVGPPWLPSLPIFGFALARSLDFENPRHRKRVERRLWPSDVKGSTDAQSLLTGGSPCTSAVSVLRAISEFSTEKLSEPVSTIPPPTSLPSPSALPRLRTTVTAFSRTTLPSAWMPPPCESDRFPATVVFTATNGSVPSTSMPPPLSPARFPLTVLPVMRRRPESV